MSLDNVKIIMEETGCDELQATLALQSAGNDLEKALKSVYNLVKNIIILKGKIKIQEINIYGLFIIIFHKTSKDIIRQAAIVSYNPEIYEISLDLSWDKFEKELYTWRLKEGALPEITQKLSQQIGLEIRTNHRDTFFKFLNNNEKEEIKSILKTINEQILNNKISKIDLSFEELNLRQFKLGCDTIPIYSERELLEKKQNDIGINTIILETEIITNTRNGVIPITKIKKNDIILSRITDKRDIAQYLSKLLGGWEKEKSIPIRVTVEKIDQKDGYCEVITRFGPGVLGKAKISNNLKVKVLKPSHIEEQPILNKKLIILGVVALGIIIIILLFKFGPY